VETEGGTEDGGGGLRFGAIAGWDGMCWDGVEWFREIAEITVQ